uniref:Sushi domain-containing protein n=1 Tax=Amphilophus citrinellus TaxID=61819 RepID=A0A3Q0RDN5_AMPCI
RSTPDIHFFSLTDENGCPCPEIPERNLTKPPTQTCFQIGSRFRYQCIDGYVRKSGTSNLIKCEATGGAPQWTEPTLECICKSDFFFYFAATSTSEMMPSASASPSVTDERNSTEAITHGKELKLHPSLFFDVLRTFFFFLTSCFACLKIVAKML